MLRGQEERFADRVWRPGRGFETDQSSSLQESRFGRFQLQFKIQRRRGRPESVRLVRDHPCQPAFREPIRNSRTENRLIVGRQAALATQNCRPGLEGHGRDFGLDRFGRDRRFRLGEFMRRGPAPGQDRKR